METKLRRQIIATFGIAFVVVVAMIVIWKLKFYDDVNAKLAKAQADYQTNKALGDQLPAALKGEAVAKENLILANDELTSLRGRFRALNFNIETDGARNRTWIGYMNEYFSGYGLEVRRQLSQAADDTNVSINTTIKIDVPPQMPENVTAPPSGFLKPGGDLTVAAVGSFPDIMNFLERVNKSPILLTVGAIKLEGASPSITATFTVTPYLLATGPSIKLQAPGAAPSADAAAGAVPAPGGE